MVATLKYGATKEFIQNLLDKISKETHSQGVSTRKYCGTIKLKEDALKIQNRLRDEWE